MICADMVKNKGFFPSGPSEIPIQRNQIKDIIFSLLPACTEPDPDSKVPFKVDAIIANPPAYGKITCVFCGKCLSFWCGFIFGLKKVSILVCFVITCISKKAPLNRYNIYISENITFLGYLSSKNNEEKTKNT